MLFAGAVGQLRPPLSIAGIPIISGEYSILGIRLIGYSQSFAYLNDVKQLDREGIDMISFALGCLFVGEFKSCLSQLAF